MISQRQITRRRRRSYIQREGTTKRNKLTKNICNHFSLLFKNFLSYLRTSFFKEIKHKDSHKTKHPTSATLPLQNIQNLRPNVTNPQK